MLRSRNSIGRPLRAVHRSPAEWLAMAEDPAFGALVARKRRYLLTGWSLVVVSYLALASGASLAPDFFARPLIGELNAGMALIIGEISLCVTVAWLYVRRAGQQFDRDAAALALRFRSRIGAATAGASDPAAD